MIQQNNNPLQDNIFDYFDEDPESLAVPSALQNRKTSATKKKKKKKVAIQQKSGMAGVGDELKRGTLQLDTLGKKQQLGVSHVRTSFVDGRSYQQIIRQSKKPTRMPPSPIGQLVQSRVEQQSQEEQQQRQNTQPKLLFHIPRGNALTDKNRKRKQLFVQDQFDSREMQEENGRNVFKAADSQIKKDSYLNKYQKGDNWEQKMMQFLKQKYGKDEEQIEGDVQAQNFQKN